VVSGALSTALEKLGKPRLGWMGRRLRCFSNG
jgi:hypothetical protein